MSKSATEILEEAIEFIRHENIAYHDNGRGGQSNCTHCGSWYDIQEQHDSDCEISKIFAAYEKLEVL